MFRSVASELVSGRFDNISWAASRHKNSRIYWFGDWNGKNRVNIQWLQQNSNYTFRMSYSFHNLLSTEV